MERRLHLQLQKLLTVSIATRHHALPDLSPDEILHNMCLEAQGLFGTFNQGEDFNVSLGK